MEQVKTKAGPAKAGEVKAKESAADGFMEMIRTIFWAVVIAIFFRTFAYEPFNIPSESMLPTLLVGDYLFVSKLSYGYSRYSMPFGLPPFEGRILSDDVERGDVAVFKFPRDNKTDYIKRIIGLPGDRIQMIQGILFLNGKSVERERIRDFIIPDKYGNIRRFTQYRETLPSGVSYNTLDARRSSADDTGVFIVPAGHYFAMGDNRDNSADSRVPNSGVGFIPAENMVGRATILFFSTDGTAEKWQIWKWFEAARFERFFTFLN